MDTQTIQVYCLCDDMLNAMQHREDRQCRLSDVEVMTVAIVAALNHGGNFIKAGEMLPEHSYTLVLKGIPEPDTKRYYTHANYYIACSSAKHMLEHLPSVALAKGH